jgi:hypothetical protein
MKKCSRCQETLPESSFHKDRRNKDGLQVYCKECRNVADGKWYKNNRERKLQYARRYREENRHIRQMAMKNWKEKNPDYYADYRKRYRESDPERYHAHIAVTNAIARNDLPPASGLVCEHCQEAQGQHYHHHNGYSLESALDVVALCTGCHGEAHRVEV